MYRISLHYRLELRCDPNCAEKYQDQGLVQNDTTDWGEILCSNSLSTPWNCDRVMGAAFSFATLWGSPSRATSGCWSAILVFDAGSVLFISRPGVRKLLRNLRCFNYCHVGRDKAQIFLPFWSSTKVDSE